MKTKIYTKKALVFLILFPMIFMFSLQANATSVSPTSVSANLLPGTSASPQPLNTGVTASSVPLDVLFILDLSSSLIDELAECKSEATTIMTQIRSSYSDSKFGVASFMDYPGTFTYTGYEDDGEEGVIYGDALSGDYAWNLDQDLTTNTDTASTTINNLTMGFGGDVPQDYTRVLYESRFVSWRNNAIKVVVLMGDAPVHDEDFYAPNTYGGDPGRDATAGTADDLDFQTVVAQLKSADIRVVTINSYTGGPHPDAISGFQYMSNQTGGLYRALGDVNDIPSTIVNAVNISAKFSSITLRAASGYENWFSFTPSIYANVGDGETKTFNITLNAPAGTKTGTYSFYIYVIGTGSGETTIANIPATVNVSTGLPETGSPVPKQIILIIAALTSILFLAIFSILSYGFLKRKL